MLLVAYRMPRNGMMYLTNSNPTAQHSGCEINILYRIKK